MDIITVERKGDEAMRPGANLCLNFDVAQSGFTVWPLRLKLQGLLIAWDSSKALDMIFKFLICADCINFRPLQILDTVLGDWHSG